PAILSGVATWMSDFFANLVTRSFSPMASVQPLGASPYSAPESLAGFLDPFAEAEKLEDDDGADAGHVSPTTHLVRTSSTTREEESDHTEPKTPRSLDHGETADRSPSESVE